MGEDWFSPRSAANYNFATTILTEHKRDQDHPPFLVAKDQALVEIHFYHFQKYSGQT